MSQYDVVASLEQLSVLDDSEMTHMHCCLVENFSWFLLDRKNTHEADTAHVTPLSENGMWVIMTPQTASIVAAAKGDDE